MLSRQAFRSRSLSVFDSFDDRVMLMLADRVDFTCSRYFRTCEQEGAGRSEWERDDPVQCPLQHFIFGETDNFGMEAFIEVQVTRERILIERWLLNGIHLV